MPERFEQAVPVELAAWAGVADTLPWETPWERLYVGEGPYGRWFVGGRLNASVACVDRHLADRADTPAILWEGEPGDRRSLTYRQLHAEVTALAGALRGLGVGVGDRVALHLGWLPELVVAMLACARIGAVHSVIPAPLPVEGLAERLEDFGPKVLVTQDGAWRHGQILPLKARADEALTAVRGVEQTIVVRRTGMDVAWYEGDRWYHELVAAVRPGSTTPDVSAASLDSDHPLCVVNLANRRGRPVTIVHGTATLLAAAAAVHRYGLSRGGVFWCAGEVSWLGVQAHGIYGPLAWGDTAVMFEGTLDVPDRKRAWRIIERYGVETLLTSPSVLHQLRGWSHQPPPARAVTSLRRVVTLGESIDPGLITWVRDTVCGGAISTDDGWGQAELGGIVTLHDPVDPERLPRARPQIVDEAGRPVPTGETGELVLKLPWAATLRAIEGAGAADVARHWARPGVYATGDRARYRPNGTIELLGRIDRIVSVSGQLVSLDEVRDLLVEQPFVQAAEVVERSDARLGRSLAAAVVLAEGVPGDATVARDLLDVVRETLGGLARPRVVLFVDRFGDELRVDDRRRALSVLAAAAADEAPRHVTWEQVLAAAPSGPGG